MEKKKFPDNREFLEVLLRKKCETEFTKERERKRLDCKERERKRLDCKERERKRLDCKERESDKRDDLDKEDNFVL